MSLERIYPIIALALLAAVTLWLDRTTSSDEARPAAALRQEPDFIGEEIRLTSFGPDGRERYRLIADRVTNYPQADLTDFERPRLRYDTEEGELTIDALRGESYDEGTIIHLRGEVHVFRRGRDDNPDLTLASDTLTIWPDDQRAATDDPVVLTRDNSIAHGNAFRADNLFGTLELIGDANVHMPPSSRANR